MTFKIIEFDENDPFMERLSFASMELNTLEDLLRFIDEEGECVIYPPNQEPYGPTDPWVIEKVGLCREYPPNGD